MHFRLAIFNSIAPRSRLRWFGFALHPEQIEGRDFQPNLLPKGERGSRLNLPLKLPDKQINAIFPLAFLFILIFNSFLSTVILKASDQGEENKNSRFMVNLVVDGMSEETEDSGAVIRINADFDEKNEDTKGNPIADYQADAKKGQRIAEDDPDLKDGSLSIEGEAAKGKWRLTFPDSIMIWKKSNNGKYAEMISSRFSDEVKVPFSCILKIEGMKGSQTTNDVKIIAEFIPSPTKQTYQDSVSLTVLETKFALSFDDGPLPDKTDKIVRALKNFYYNGEPVKAAFFQIGFKIHKFDELTRFVDQQGHLVGNHTQYHERYGHEMLKDKTIREDIVRCEEEIRRALGKEPVKIIRNRSLWQEERFDRMAQEMGYKVCGGEMLKDWEPSASLEEVKKRAEQVLSDWNTKENPRLHPYPVILIFHEFPEVTCDHIGEIIRYLQDRGFELVNFDPNQMY